MSVESKETARKRTQMLLELRKQHGESVKQGQDRLKEQQAIRKSLQCALQGAPRSVPQLAIATGVAAHAVLWHIAAMKKYGLLEEAGMDDAGEYYLYALSKGAKA